MTGLSVIGLSVAFRGASGAVQALRDVSFSIGPGEMLGLVGESGSGKSTAAFSLMGLLPPNAQVLSGQAMLNGKTFDLAGANQIEPMRGRDMAMVFQDPLLSLNPVFTVGTHLAEALRRRDPMLTRRQRHDRMEAALATVGMADPARRIGQFPGELSGGMRQRVVIAMALLARPALLIADEPTTALDATVEAQVMAAIRTMRDEIGCSVLLITHSLGLVAQHCDTVAVLYAGERVETGTVADVTGTPGHPYARLLLDCEVTLDVPRGAKPAGERFTVIPGALPDLRHRPLGCIFATRCDRVMPDCTVHRPEDRMAHGAGHVARCLLLPKGTP